MTGIFLLSIFLGSLCWESFQFLILLRSFFELDLDDSTTGDLEL